MRSIRSRVLVAFGLGWLVGVGLVMIGLLVRFPPAWEPGPRRDLGALVIGVVSVLVLVLILSIPGLVALSLARRNAPHL